MKVVLALFFCAAASFYFGYEVARNETYENTFKENNKSIKNLSQAIQNKEKAEQEVYELQEKITKLKVNTAKNEQVNKNISSVCSSYIVELHNSTIKPAHKNK